MIVYLHSVYKLDLVAQLVEHLPFKERVLGSRPSPVTKNVKQLLNIFILIKSARGEIGRRAALRGLFSQESGSSNLLVRTFSSFNRPFVKNDKGFYCKFNLIKKFYHLYCSMKKLLLLIFIFASFKTFSQKDSLTVKNLKGQIIHASTKKYLSAAHILNLNTVEGTITNDNGYFEIPTKINDTVLVSYLGYASIKLRITNDLLKGNELLIALYEKPEEIKEVVIKSTKLIGVLEIDVKQVPKDRFTRIKINGLPQTYEVGKPKVKDFSSPLAALFQPVDFLYNLFGQKPKQLRKLKKLKQEDDLRKMLAGKFDREVMMEYLQMDSKELAELLVNCDYSEYFIRKASDLQVIEAVLDCYENYKAIKKGKIDRNKIPVKN